VPLALLAAALVVLGVLTLRGGGHGPLLATELGTSSTGLPIFLDAAGQPGIVSVAGQELASTMHLADGTSYRFPTDFTAAAQRATAVNDPVLGPSEQLTSEYASRDGRVQATIRVTASRDGPALIYEMLTPSSPSAPAQYSLFDAEPSGFELPGPVEYLSVLSTGRVTQTLSPDDPTAVALLPDAPFVLWSEEGRYGYAFGVLDVDERQSVVRLSRPDASTVRVVPELAPRADAPTASPRLYVERIGNRDFSRSLAGLRAAINAAAPQPPIPADFRQQWGSWYVYGGGITEDLIRSQIDTIAERYGDVGPWQVVLDAGWYLAGPDPEGQVGRVDREKFPSGLRAVVDYAHARGLDVVLYWPAPWVESDPAATSWWVVQLGFVRDHQDWLIYVEGDDRGATYVYDMANPELRAYLQDQLRQYLIEFNADGIEADMIGIVGDAGGPFRGGNYGVEEINRHLTIGQTMEVYRFLWETATSIKPDAWLESGYAVPPLARQYAHSFRVADDYPTFSNPYPFAGLLEQITFNALRQHFLGRRPNLGFVHANPEDPDDPENLSIQQQWLAAAVAMQSQVNVSVDLAETPPETARMYREYLAALYPFSAEVVYGPGLPPDSLSTTVGGTTYVGLLNPDTGAKAVQVGLSRHGLPLDTALLAYDPERDVALSVRSQLSYEVPGTHFSLLALRSAPGVLWGDRAATADYTDGRLRVHVDPSGFGAGRLLLYAPNATAVDGLPDAAWTLDESLGLLTVDLPNGAAYDFDVMLAR
jgi:hypothetical protein